MGRQWTSVVKGECTELNFTAGQDWHVLLFHYFLTIIVWLNGQVKIIGHMSWAACRSMHGIIIISSSSEASFAVHRRLCMVYWCSIRNTVNQCCLLLWCVLSRGSSVRTPVKEAFISSISCYKPLLHRWSVSLPTHAVLLQRMFKLGNIENTSVTSVDSACIDSVTYVMCRQSGTDTTQLLLLLEPEWHIQSWWSRRQQRIWGYHGKRTMLVFVVMI